MLTVLSYEWNLHRHTRFQSKINKGPFSSRIQSSLPPEVWNTLRSHLEKPSCKLLRSIPIHCFWHWWCNGGGVTRFHSAWVPTCYVENSILTFYSCSNYWRNTQSAIFLSATVYVNLLHTNTTEFSCFTSGYSRTSLPVEVIIWRKANLHTGSSSGPDLFAAPHRRINPGWEMGFQRNV